MAVTPVTRAVAETWKAAIAAAKKNDHVDDIIILNRFRLRVCQTSQLPIVQDSAQFAHSSEVLVIDLPDTNKKSDETLNNQTVKLESTRDVPMEDDDFEGSPMKFNFLTLAILQRESHWNTRTTRYIFGAIQYFKCNPVLIQQALRLRDLLLAGGEAAKILDADLAALPIWIISDASDSLGSSLIGFQKNMNKIITNQTYCLGSFDATVASKLAIQGRRFPSVLTRKSRAKAVYGLLKKTQSSVLSTNAVHGNITLTVRWDVAPEDYLVAPSTSVQAIVYISPGWKDKRISLDDRTKDLEHLLCLAQSLSGEGVCGMFWPNMEDLNESVPSRVQTLITQSGRINLSTEKTEQRFLDFTEQLWVILKDCTSYESLVEGLKLVFAALKAAKINTLLHDDNRSVIARLVRDSLAGTLQLHRLEGKTPIQLLLEVGLDKLRRDIVNGFIENELITNETQLDAYFKLTSDPEDRAFALLPIHLSLQTMLELKKLLVSNHHQQLGTMTRLVLTRYCNKPISDISAVHFETNIDMVDLQPDLIYAAPPKLWTNETTYIHNGKARAQTLVHFARETQFEHLERLVNAKTVKMEEEISATKQNEEDKENMDMGDTTIQDKKPLNRKSLNASANDTSEIMAKNYAEPHSSYICTLTTTSFTNIHPNW